MLQLAKIFQSSMVLQQQKAAVIWGTAKAQEEVTVKIQGKSARTYADIKGNWKIDLPMLEASCQETMVVKSQAESLVLEDIAVGEVWLAGGQSNMEFYFRYEKYAATTRENLPKPNIRFYDVPEVCYTGQIEEFDYSNMSVWRKALPEEIDWFSVVGYYFAEALETSLRVPVGIIGCNWGGTTSSAWMSMESVKRVGKGWYLDYEKILAEKDMEAYWNKQHGNPMNDRGNPMDDPFTKLVLPKTITAEELAANMGNLSEDFDGDFTEVQPQSLPASLYEHMLKPLAPFALRGVIWYQGESDDVPGRQSLYQDMLTALIGDWRALWQEELPFLIVQLPGWEKWLDSVNHDYTAIRRCQEQTVKNVPQAYLCSVSDVGEQFDIHPKDKRTVGGRLALLARGHVYKESIVCDTPQAVSVEIGEKSIGLTFENAAGGLYVKGKELSAMQLFIDGQEKAFAYEIQNEKLTLYLDERIQGTVTVSFAQTEWYLVNLYNQAGLPAIPFLFEV